MGQGAQKFETADAKQLLIVNPDLLPQGEGMAHLIADSGRENIMPISAEIYQPCRRALDCIIFDVLGLTQGERDAVYEAVVNLVEARLKKARSLR